MERSISVCRECGLKPAFVSCMCSGENMLLCYECLPHHLLRIPRSHKVINILKMRRSQNHPSIEIWTKHSSRYLYYDDVHGKYKYDIISQAIKKDIPIKFSSYEKRYELPSGDIIFHGGYSQELFFYYASSQRSIKLLFFSDIQRFEFLYHGSGYIYASCKFTHPHSRDLSPCSLKHYVWRYDIYKNNWDRYYEKRDDIKSKSNLADICILPCLNDSVTKAYNSHAFRRNNRIYTITEDSLQIHDTYFNKLKEISLKGLSLDSNIAPREDALYKLHQNWGLIKLDYSSFPTHSRELNADISQYLYSPIKNSSKLVQYDLKQKSFREIEILSKELINRVGFPESIRYCILPSGKFFFYLDSKRVIVNPTNLKATILNNNLMKRRLPGLVYYNNSVYVFGGCRKFEHVNYAERFDMNDGTWHILENMIEFRRDPTCFTLHNKIYIAGGKPTIEVYDVENNRYSLGSISFGSSYILAFAVDNEIYVIENDKYQVLSEDLEVIREIKYEDPSFGRPLSYVSLYENRAYFIIEYGICHKRIDFLDINSGKRGVETFYQDLS